MRCCQGCHWNLFNLLSWTQLNFAGKPAVNAWDRSWVGTKCSHTVHVRHNIVLGHACSCSASCVCNKCKLGLTAEVYFIFCGMIEVWVFLVILSNRIYILCKLTTCNLPPFFPWKLFNILYRNKLLNYLLISWYEILFSFDKGFSNQAFFAVYDGHSGVDASNFSATHLHCHLARNKNLDIDPRLALKEAFEKTDECFVAKAKREVTFLVWL